MFSISILARTLTGLGLIACGACSSTSPKSDVSVASRTFYTVTGEIALSRHEPRIAALQYAAAAEGAADLGLLRRATEVTADALQPSLTMDVATRWIGADGASLDAHRAVARAALDLQQIERSAEQYGVVLLKSPRGTEAEFAALELELATTDNVFGARQLADRLAEQFTGSTAARRLQGYAALRADDPAAAARSFSAALAATPGEHHDLTQALWRARILAGDVEEPLVQAKALLDRGDSEAARLDYALLLLAAQRSLAAVSQLELLTHRAESAPAALRLLGLIGFQQGHFDDAGLRFTELLSQGKYADDDFYYLGLISEQHQDVERALRLYAQVQAGENALPAYLRAAALLRSHGAAPEAEELLDRLAEEKPERAPEILAARARIYTEGGESRLALDLLDRSVQEYPDSVELRYARASTYEEHGDISAALRELQTVVKLRPDDPAALNAFGFTLADHHRRLGKARALIERAYAAAPNNTAILDSLGWVLFRQGQGERALPYLNAAYADDRGGDVAAHLGEVLWHLGRRADADKIWAQASEIDADNHLLKATRTRLHAAN